VKLIIYLHNTGLIYISRPLLACHSVRLGFVLQGSWRQMNYKQSRKNNSANILLRAVVHSASMIVVNQKRISTDPFLI